MTHPPSVLVVGAGAIGAFYGAILHRGGARVSVVCRSDVDTVRETGFRVDSKALGDLSFRPAAVYGSAEECNDPPDYLVVALKVVDGIDRVSAIRPAVGRNTTIVLIENGIDIEPEIAQAFPDNKLLSGLAFTAATRVGPGHVEHKAYGRLVLGDYPRGAGPEALRFGALLDAGGVTGKVVEDVVGERWLKCVWNTAFNPVSVVAGGAGTLTMLDAPGGEDFLRTLMREVCGIAAADGHPMPEALVPKSLAGTRKMPDYKTSMAEDWLNERPMEVEAILGNAVHIARRRNVAVPHLESVYALIRMLTANRGS